MDSRHHVFIQAVMNRGPLSADATMSLFKSIMGSSSGDGFVPFLGTINKELEFVQWEVKKVMNQNDGTEVYGIINTLPSKEAKLGTKYNQAQILYFTAVVEAIVQDPSASGTITISRVLNLRPEQQAQIQGELAASSKLSLQEKEESLKCLVSDRLLSRTAEGGVTLGVRSFLELRSLFRNLGVPFCAVCNEAAIKAQLCRNDECPVRIHSYCLRRKSRSRNQILKCPDCGKEWKQRAEENPVIAEEEDFVPIATQEPARGEGRDETAARGLDDGEMGMHRAKRTRGSTGIVGKAEADDVGQEPGSNFTVHVTARGRRSATKPRRKNLILDDEAESQPHGNGPENEPSATQSRLKRKGPLEDDEEIDVEGSRNAEKRRRLRDT